jgi:hypothetical protein
MDILEGTPLERRAEILCKDSLERRSSLAPYGGPSTFVTMQKRS